MAEITEQIIAPEVTRMLSDGKPETRKRGATEVDRIMQGLCMDQDWMAIHSLIKYLRSAFLRSVQNSLRKGGLLALSAVSIALGHKYIGDFVLELVEAAIELFEDCDQNVRYHAAECLYNVAKVARGLVLVEFGSIFNAMCNLKADNDRYVQGASDTLDGILRDIATESKSFNVDKFVQTIKNHIASTKPRIRQYVLSWLMLLDSVPDIDLVQYLPEFLGGVLDILSDQDKKIAGLADKVANCYLQRLRDMVATDKAVDWGPIVTIVIKACRKQDDRTRGVALTWLVEILMLSRFSMTPFIPQILQVVLVCLADNEESIRTKAGVASENIAALFGALRDGETETDRQLPDILPKIFDTLTEGLQSPELATKSAALKWLHMVLDSDPHLIATSFESLFQTLLQLLGDPADQVVELSLQVLAMFTQNNSDVFHKFLSELVVMLQADGFKHMTRAGTIIKILAKRTPPAELFSLLSSILSGVSDLAFVSAFVTNLNIILLTSPELLPLRDLLKKGLSDTQARSLFTELYFCWSHNAVSLLSLCLLAKAYKHAYTLVRVFGEMEITVSMLVQLDKLIQILESPVFTYVRLGLLEPEENPYLIKTLFGVLMLLPQSTAFDDLHKRLKSVSTLCSLNNSMREQEKRDKVLDKNGNASDDTDGVDWSLLLSHYRKVEDEKVSFAKGHNVMSQ
ncbi:Protein VAC14-like protein [Diplonema papillatum]|nr:Protein VAC14-like protein [Diplonema papillatum]